MIRLHLGCGPVIKEGWLNYDLEPGPGGIKHDLTKPLPHEDNSVEEIFTEHFIEHITRAQGVALLRECFRVLKPRGRVRVTTPDLKQLARQYLVGEPDERWLAVWKPETPCQMMNEGMRLWGHQFLYDGRELSLALKEAGFPAVFYCTHGKHEARPFTGEICMEAFK